MQMIEEMYRLNGLWYPKLLRTKCKDRLSATLQYYSYVVF